MPVDWKRYPPDWKAVVERIRARSGDKCEWCGVANGSQGQWEEGEWLPARCIIEPASWYNLKRAGLTKIILTTAHLGTVHPDGRPGDKHDKMDVRDDNLAHLCQRCHLRYDMPEHMNNARRTRNRKRGQIDMLEVEAE